LFDRLAMQAIRGIEPFYEGPADVTPWDVQSYFSRLAEDARAAGEPVRFGISGTWVTKEMEPDMGKYHALVARIESGKADYFDGEIIRQLINGARDMRNPNSGLLDITRETDDDTLGAVFDELEPSPVIMSRGPFFGGMFSRNSVAAYADGIVAQQKHSDPDASDSRLYWGMHSRQPLLADRFGDAAIDGTPESFN